MARSFSGPRLRAARTAAKISRTNLAAEIGVSYRMLYLYEQGRSVPSGNALIRLIDVLGCDFDELIAEAIAA